MLRITKNTILSSKHGHGKGFASLLLAVAIMMMLAVPFSVPDSGGLKAAESAVPVYRLYNPNSGEHFYTLNSTERDNAAAAGWRYEGIGWYAPVSSAFPVYRLFNPNAHDAGSHHYTMSSTERDQLVSYGWKYEGMVFYSYDIKAPDCIKIYRSYNPNDGGHNYTNSKAEYDNLDAAGWQSEGVGLGAVKQNSSPDDPDPGECDHTWATASVKEYVPEVGHMERHKYSQIMYHNYEYRGYDECGCGKLWDTAAQAAACHGHWGPQAILIEETYPNDSWAGHGWYDGDYPRYNIWITDEPGYYKTVTYTYCTKCGKGTYHPAEGHFEKVVDTKSFTYIAFSRPETGYTDSGELIYWCPFCNKTYTPAEVDAGIKAQKKAYPEESVDEVNVECKFCSGTNDCSSEHLCWKYKEVKKTLPEQSHKVWVIDKKAYTE